MTLYFYIAFAWIVIGIVLNKAGLSPAKQDHARGTLMVIEFHSRERKAENSAAAAVLLSLSTTEHVGNLSKDDNAKFT